MNLADLFRKSRRSEPTILLALKIFTMIMLIASLTGYLIVVIIDVKQDASIIMTSFVNVDAIRPPHLHFSSSLNHSISNCVEFYSLNDDVKMIECAPEDTSEFFDTENQIYSSNYFPSPNVLFDEKLLAITMYFNIYEKITLEKPSQINLVAFDSEFIMDYSSSYDKSIFTMNRYTLEPGQTYEFSYSRVIRELIKPSWMNDFGVPPTYEQKPSISSSLLGGPLNNNLNNLMKIDIRPKSTNLVQVDREVRTHTYLSGLGLIGGAWGLAAAVYAFLFGADTLRPWGIVQSYCCGFSRVTQKKLRVVLPAIPFFDTLNPSPINHAQNHYADLPLAKQNELILSRIDSLELFLQEYVVDVQYLDGIRKNDRNNLDFKE
ncbi:hypothetical protein C1645_741947 [Glomus cerebriforme]|uniref:Uncharacterized protein n=1 Tax=Glomus cerebriforme TaxID=658196 RepID=A0A397SQL4_9GLOM|nr:hypothetical protein C1645_741947 [Glomus cerebriforme]